MNNRVGVYFFLSYYIAVNLTGITYFSIAGFHGSLFDIVTLFWIVYFLIKHQYINKIIKYLQIEIFIILLFLIYTSFICLKGIYPKNLAMFLQLIRDIIIMFMGMYFIQSINIDKLNKSIVNFAFYFAVLMLIFLFFYLFFHIKFLPILELGEGIGATGFNFIRFKALSGDSNFYGLLISLALFISVYTLKGVKKYIYISIFIISIIFTFSRSIFASLFLSFIIMNVFINFSFRKLAYFIFVIIIFIIIAMIPIFDNLSLLDLYMMRMEKGSPRFAMWTVLWNYFLDNPIFGYGLRYSEYFIEGITEAHFAHNSYLELLVEYGLVGFLIWILFIIRIFIKSLYLKNDDLYKPWIQIFIMLGILFGGFTIMYWPFDWVIYSILLGGYVKYVNRYNNYKLQ